MGSRSRRVPATDQGASPQAGPDQQQSSGGWLSDLRELLFGSRDTARDPVQEAEQGPAEDVLQDAGLGGVLGAAEAGLEVEPYDVTQDTHVRAAEGGERVTLQAGTTLTLTADQVAGDWEALARDLGTTPDKLAAFNEDVDVLAVGTQIYVPSAEERLFAEYRARYDFEEAVTEFYAAKEGSSVAVYAAASDRASGVIGESYGTQGVDGRFYTPNTDVSGATRRTAEEIDGQTEYKVFWLDEFWKCSIFMNDAVWQGGYEPALMSNGHYSLAGRAHEQTRIYEQVDVANARPGDAWQRFGGRGSNESHNAVLSSFVDISQDPNDPEVDIWEFKIIGAEEERAAESTRIKRMNAGTNETTDGEVIRFLRPRRSRPGAE